MVSRPNSVTVIGWLFIGLGCMAMLSGVVGTIVTFVSPIPVETPSKMPDALPPFQLLARVLGYLPLLGLVMIVVIAILIGMVIRTLRGRAVRVAVGTGAT